MSDVVRPSKENFDSVLRESCKLWSAYLGAGDTEPTLPFDCIELKNILARTPCFLAHGIYTDKEQISFDCVEKGTPPGPYDLFVSGKSKWETSNGPCDLEPMIIPQQLLLATQSPLKIEFSDNAPFAEWPNVKGLYNNDEGNYVAILLLAWTYILSARWAELLRRSSDHDCTVGYVTQTDQLISQSPQRHDIELDIGDDNDGGEARWWDAVLAADKGWKIGAYYNHKAYLSPWSVSIPDSAFIRVRKTLCDTTFEPPSSKTALEYLARFCAHHRLYGQCSAALAAALYIPLLSGRLTSLPMPKPRIKSVMQIQPSSASTLAQTTVSHLELVAEYGRLLPYYMSLSSDIWGMRSLLCSTFFNPDVECNLVSAWLNPAFAVIDPLLKAGDMPRLAALLGRRHPRLAILWLGAIIMGIAKSELRDIRNGLTALNLHAAAWTGTIQSFITLKPGTTDGQMIRREDEGRLLFITASDGRGRVPMSPWKPFGESHLCDTELKVRQHAQCGCHCLEYKAWYWSCTDGEDLEDPGLNQYPSDHDTSDVEKLSEPSSSLHYPDCSSRSLSEGATRGIFEWLRLTGYPACEKPLYQHSWIDIGSSDDDDPGDSDSDAVRSADSTTESIEKWLGGVDYTEISPPRDHPSRLSGLYTPQNRRAHPPAG